MQVIANLARVVVGPAPWVAYGLGEATEPWGRHQLTGFFGDDFWVLNMNETFQWDFWVLNMAIFCGDLPIFPDINGLKY